MNKIIIMVIILTLFGMGISESVSQTSTFTNRLDENFTKTTDMTISNNKFNINQSLSSFVLEPYLILNNREYNFNNIPSLSSNINPKLRLTDLNNSYKFAFNFTNINGIKEVGFNYKGFKHTRYYLYNKDIMILFDDLLQQKLNVTITDNKVIITGFNGSFIDIDPFVTKNGATFFSDGTGFDWSTPSNAQNSDDVYTTITTPRRVLRDSSNHISSNFGFNIPTGSSIDGIKLEIERKKSTTFSGTLCTDTSISLTQDAGNGYGYTLDSNGWTTEDAYYTWGSSTNLWNNDTAWTPEIINDAGFGAMFSLSAFGSATFGITCSVDHLRITIYYTPPVSSCSVSSLLSINNSTTSLPFVNLGECQVNNNLTIGYNNLVLSSYPFVNISSLGGLILKPM